MGQQVFAPGVEDGQIAQRCAQHEASAAEHAEQDIVHRAPGRAARHESQRHEHQPRKQGDEPRGIRSCVRFLRREAVLRPEVLRFLFAMFPKTRSLFYIMKQGALRAALPVTMEEFRYDSILSLYHGKSQMAIYFPSISR